MGQRYATCNASRIITGYYDDALCMPPADMTAIRITVAQLRAMLAGQSAGRQPAVDDAGKPVLLDPSPTTGELAGLRRAERNAALATTDWLTSRHRDELTLGGNTTLAPDEYAALIAYRNALRDLTDAAGWPEVELPPPPGFVSPP